MNGGGGVFVWTIETKMDKVTSKVWDGIGVSGLTLPRHTGIKLLNLFRANDWYTRSFCSYILIIRDKHKSNFNWLSNCSSRQITNQTHYLKIMNL